VLTHDWNKYRDSVVACVGVDAVARTFDIRIVDQGPIAMLPGHQYAVRRVSWSPHLADVFITGSYDLTARVWTDGTAVGADTKPDPMVYGGGRCLGLMERHTEFVMGVDWCLFGAEGWCATTGWDERVLIWDVRTIMG
jgi:peroxin-7